MPPCLNQKKPGHPKLKKPAIPPENAKGVNAAFKLGYRYNFGHFCTLIGAALEILSLFLPNKSDLLKKDGMTMLDQLRMLIQQILINFFEEPEAETISIITNIIIIIYFSLLILWCIQIETTFLTIAAMINMAVVAFSGYKIYEYTENNLNVVLGLIEGKMPVTGLGYWLFLASGILILVSSLIAHMISSNEKYKR